MPWARAGRGSTGSIRVSSLIGGTGSSRPMIGDGSRHGGRARSCHAGPVAARLRRARRAEALERHVLERRVDEPGPRVAERALEGPGQEARAAGDPERLVGRAARRRSSRRAWRARASAADGPRLARRATSSSDDPCRAQRGVQAPEAELDRREVGDGRRAVARPAIDRPARPRAAARPRRSRGRRPRCTARTRSARRCRARRDRPPAAGRRAGRAGRATSVSRSRPDAEPRMPSASKPGRRSTPGRVEVDEEVDDRSGSAARLASGRRRPRAAR